MPACDRYAPKDSLSGAVNYICNYLKEHPGWSREDIVKLIEELQKEEFVNSFNGRSGDVTLEPSDVNNLEIASAYFALTDNVEDLNITDLYEKGVRLVFAGYSMEGQHYTELYALNKYGGLVHKERVNPGAQEVSYPVTSVNGKTGAVKLKLEDVLIDSASSAQVWMGTKVNFESTETATWNALYKTGYRLAVVVDDQHENVTGLYVLNQGSGQVNNTPIPVQLGGGGEPVDPSLVTQVQKNTEAIAAINDEMPRKYSPTNEPPYPVTSVNGKNGVVNVEYLRSNTNIFKASIEGSYSVLNSMNNEDVVSSILFGKTDLPTVYSRNSRGMESLAAISPLRILFGNENLETDLTPGIYFLYIYRDGLNLPYGNATKLYGITVSNENYDIYSAFSSGNSFTFRADTMIRSNGFDVGIENISGKYFEQTNEFSYGITTTFFLLRDSHIKLVFY